MQFIKLAKIKGMFATDQCFQATAQNAKFMVGELRAPPHPPSVALL